MRRGRDRFCFNAEESQQNRFRGSQMYPQQLQNAPAHADAQPSQVTLRYPSPNPDLSQSVNDHIKELRTMSSSSTDGKNVCNISSFGNGLRQQRNPMGMESSEHGQHHKPQLPSVPFRPPVPPPPFHPSLPPPGLPPFHSPHPHVGSGGSGAVFNQPPPSLPPPGSVSCPPQSSLSAVQMQWNLGMPPPPSLSSNSAAPPVRPPVTQSSFRMTGLSDRADPSSSNIGIPPLPRRFPSPDITSMEKLLSGSDFPRQSGASATQLVALSQSLQRKMSDDHDSTEGQQEVNSWLHKKRKRTLEVEVTHDKCKTTKTDASAMGEAQDNLRSVLHALAAVQVELQQLEEQQERADAPTWQSRISKIRHLKEAYLETKQELDIEQLKLLKPKLDVCRKKRERQKHRKQADKEAEQQIQFERAQKHAAINQWLEKLQQNDLNQQQMKKMKEVVDKTLSKVRREIREVHKMMDTISRLQKLRAIRNDTAEKRGQTFPPSLASHFTEKTDDLLQLLMQQLDAFQKEEDALKLILETENEEAKEKEKEERRQKEREIRQKEMEEERQSLFGISELPGPGDPMQPFAQYYLQAMCSLQALQNIRQEWDSFLVPDTTPLASRIPDGWISPEHPSSSVWASILQTQPT